MATFDCVAQKAVSMAHWFIIFFHIPENFLNEPNVIFRGLGKMIPKQSMKPKISWHCPFFHIINNWPCENDDKIRIKCTIFSDENKKK